MKVSESQLEWIASKSLRNCHAMGLDSVLFDDTPGARVRAFVAHENHEMYKNTWGETLSVGLHAHHCDLTLVPVYGKPENVKMAPAWMSGRLVSLQKFNYVSQILTGKGGFVPEGERMYAVLIKDPIDKPTPMKAEDMHSVYVPRGEEAAWFVYEGKENPHYQPVCWSNADLDKLDFSKLYKPMSVLHLRVLLGKLGVEVTR